MLNKNFLEKYRPEKREDIVGNELIKERIFAYVDNNNLPNMILNGEPGLGKTSIIHVVCKELLKDYYYRNCIIFNCSDKTGIDNIRENIIKTAELTPIGTPIRIFILEESEQLSNHAQNALKKPTEEPFDKYNRFVFLSNKKSKFIDAIIDRCRVFDYLPIKPDEMFPRLKYIAETEKINISDDLIKELAYKSNGSMRYPILQLEEFKMLNRKITYKDIKMVESLETIKEIFKLLKNKKIPNAKDKVLELYEKGNNFYDIIKHFHDFTMLSLGDITNFKVKAKTLVKIAEAEKNVKEGCNEFLQLSFILSNISLLLNDNTN